MYTHTHPSPSATKYTGLLRTSTDHSGTPAARTPSSESTPLSLTNPQPLENLSSLTKTPPLTFQSDTVPIMSQPGTEQHPSKVEQHSHLGYLIPVPKQAVQESCGANDQNETDRDDDPDWFIHSTLRVCKTKYPKVGRRSKIFKQASIKCHKNVSASKP